MTAMLIDTHCHLTSGKLAPRVAEVLQEARRAGVAGVVSAATGVADAKAALGLARRNAQVFCSAGVHPHEAAAVGPHYIRQLREIILAGGSKCVAVGEIGLDYHYDYSPRADQRRIFAEQLELAVEMAKPVIVHTREAAADTLAALAPFAGRLTGVIHSFSGNAEEAGRFVQQGWHIGFSGIVTFPKAPEVAGAARIVPLDRLLVETDAPYLSPEPVRKTFPNVPAHVIHTARRLSELQGIDLDTLVERTAANAEALFGLDIPPG